MEPGRELDRLVMVHVLGWPVYESWDEFVERDRDVYPAAFWNTQHWDQWSVAYEGQNNYCRFRPSSDFSDIGIVMDGLARHHIALYVCNYALPGAYTMSEGRKSDPVVIGLNALPDTRSQSSRCALAVCRAALLAIIDPARHVWYVEKVIRGEIVADYVFDHYINAPLGLCTLCANTGVVDTRGRKSAAGVEAGILNWCLCPNGQAMRAAHPLELPPSP